MEALIKEQERIMRALQELWRNYKKDGKDRKTPEYIQNKLETIEVYWKEFEIINEKLKIYENVTDDEYFTDDHYEKTKMFCEEITDAIKKYSPTEKETLPQVSSKQPINPETLFTTEKLLTSDADKKLGEMLRKQTSNFKAFSRTLSNIDISNIKEKWEFEDVLKNIESRWSVIDKLHWDIDSQLDDQRNEEYETFFNKHEANYIQVKKDLNSKLWSVFHREKSTPKLDIPEFNGNYQQWVSFKDLFTEAIHENPCLSNAQKMQFLKSKIKGEPERLIQHLQISTENYITCWDILCHRYSNKKLIFTTHMNTLMGLPVLQQATTNQIKRIHDVTQECLNGIKNLGVDITSWDPILIHILTQKLDNETHNDYLESLKQPREIPSLKEFLEFLESKFTALEASRRKQDNTVQKLSQPGTSSNNYNRPALQRPYFTPRQYFTSNKATSNTQSQKLRVNCPVCQEEHGIYFCRQFLEMTPILKRSTIEKLNFCYNCLYNHNGKQCNSSKRCRQCNGCHNTLLHDAFTKQTNTRQAFTPKESGQRPSASHVARQRDAPEILLATAKIRVQGADGVLRTMRALIDQGSQVSLITENAAQQLKLQRQGCNGVITGIGTNDNTLKGMININCTSLSGSYLFSTDVYIMNSLTRNLPIYSFPKPAWSILENLELADPEFYISQHIDILLGADVYASIIMEGLYKQESLPALQQTRLGWILCGKVQSLQCNVVLNNLDEIKKYWEIEDIGDTIALTTEEQECIEFYNSTTARLDDGSYEVRLPLKQKCTTVLGQSKHKAIAQFQQVERKFIRNDFIATQYKAFINEYLALGHMIPATATESGGLDYYMPHHCVLREDSTTTALRVVFNASQSTSNGTSLNDIMHKGPNLQNDLLLLILKWRQHKIAFIADVEKMFRQIWVNSMDQRYQKIVWRQTPSELLQEYQLTTVTYGTKAAPFLAMMTLRRLAHDERENYPEAAKVVEESFYMDDVMHGSHSIEAARKLQHDLKSLMASGGFNLRKWMSNCIELLHDNKIEKQTYEQYNFKQPESTKTLGLHWDPKQDNFFFKCKIDPTATTNTKRKLLSEISKLFDPQGWLTPISTKFKLLFQKLWKTNLQWDDKLPDDVNKEWSKIKQEIEIINQFTIPRWLGTNAASDIELHGYCDASKKAYACVIYCKIKHQGQTNIHLVVGKSKLVPLNKEITLPKLELSGAYLLARLMKKVEQSLSSHNIKVYGWTDSTAVLGWLQGNPENWKVFVANRVRSITEVMPPSCWRYVKSGENPADCASRGLTPSQLANHNLWWNGPVTLKKEKEHEVLKYQTTEEIKSTKHAVHVVAADDLKTKQNVMDTLLTRCSNLNKVIRVLAWIRRFITKKQDRRQETYLTLQEIKQVKMMIVKHVQQSSFEDEIRKLSKNEKISSKSKILNLNPYLDPEGMLRVGGRLQHAHIEPEMKNPIIMPRDNRLTELIINHAHKLTYHGGARVTMAFIRRKYWIVGGNSAVKKLLRRCVTCKHQNPEKLNQIMGDLPQMRVNQSRPFKHTGIDFTGHVYIKTNKGRGVKTTKGYVAVFVCMVTKAVHLELVSDLTTSALMAAVRRMAARRGSPTDIYSDNGRNFVGASNVLQTAYQDIEQAMNDFMAEVADMEIKWHFNAPAWPSAGGLWEAAVKSFKFHFKRVIGEQKLTYEEFTTLLSQIEACMNTRPLCALTEDPEDLDYLSPSHFLTGGNTLTLVETEHDLRTRWQMTQKILQDIWKRWRAEYLTQLNARCKWRHPQKNIDINDIVLIHDDNLPPGKWAMGRVTALHPGQDGYVRVVTLKTKSGFMKRPIIKLSLLLENEDQNNTTQVSKNTVESSRIPPKKTSKRQSSKMNFTTLVAAVMLFFTFISSSECNVSINQFKDNQSIFFDKITNMMQIRDEWNLVVYYNMEPYWQASRTFNSYIQSLQQTCDVIKSQAHCDVILLQLRQAYSELEYYDQMLLSQYSRTRPARQRRRRGLINGVGYIANSLFGVLDEQFAEKYKQDIEMIRVNQKHLAILWKNQTSVIEAEYNLLQRTEAAMNTQYKLINKHMIDLEAAMNTQKKDIEKSYMTNDFNTGAMIANNMLQGLKSIQNMLLDTITDIYHGRFNLHLITPEQLINELSIIASKLPKDISLPIDNIHTDLRKIYKILQVKTRMLEEVLIFEIKIPLISRDTYEIMQMSGIPRQVGTQMLSIVPVSNYIAVNMEKDAFILMTSLDVKECLIATDIYLCNLQKPIFQLRDDKNFCEVVGQGCLIKTDNFTFLSHKAHHTEINVKPELYTPIIAPINYVINLTLPDLEKGNASDETQIQQDLLQVQNNIRELKNVEVISDKITYHDIHHYAMIYVILVIVGIIGLILLARRFRCTQCSWRVPHAPATAAAEETERPAAPRAPPAARAPPAVRRSTTQNQANTIELFEM